ncbi:hypothetical protein IAT38_002185 [Cryptococcus sp. DSM 104549]
MFRRHTATNNWAIVPARSKSYAFIDSIMERMQERMQELQKRAENDFLLTTRRSDFASCPDTPVTISEASSAFPTPPTVLSSLPDDGDKDSLMRLFEMHEQILKEVAITKGATVLSLSRWHYIKWTPAVYDHVVVDMRLIESLKTYKSPVYVRSFLHTTSMSIEHPVAIVQLMKYITACSDHFPANKMPFYKLGRVMVSHGVLCFHDKKSNAYEVDNITFDRGSPLRAIDTLLKYCKGSFKEMVFRMDSEAPAGIVGMESFHKRIRPHTVTVIIAPGLNASDIVAKLQPWTGGKKLRIEFESRGDGAGNVSSQVYDLVMKHVERINGVSKGSGCFEWEDDFCFEYVGEGVKEVETKLRDMPSLEEFVSARCTFTELGCQ